MKKRWFPLLTALVLVLFCVACQSPTQGEPAGEDPAQEGGQTQEEVQEQPESASEGQETAQAAGEGLLTAEEITTLEGLYGKPMEEVLTALSLNAEKASVQDEISITFEGVRTIAGQAFNETLNFSPEEGFYGADYRTGFAGDRGSLPETFQQIYDEAVTLYGEPDTYPGLGEILSEQLAEGQITGMETWAVSDGTTLTIKAEDMGDLVVFSLSYQVTVSNN